MTDDQRTEMLTEAKRLREEFIAKLPPPEAEKENRLLAAVAGAIDRAGLERVIEWLDSLRPTAAHLDRVGAALTRPKRRR